MKPIIQYIAEHLQEEGTLPKDFSLDKYRERGALPFADGAQDGIYVYHTLGQELDAQEKEQLKTVCRQLVAGPIPSLTEKAVLTFSKNHPAIQVIDEFQRCLLEMLTEENMETLVENMSYLVFDSTHVECVKYGMEIMEVLGFGEWQEDNKDMIRWLGASDEFTLFSVFNMQRIKNSVNVNQEIFELAKKVHGWGRIHAVEHLEPETEEIRQWLWLEGWKNDIMPEYSAEVCFVKSGAEEVWDDEEKRKQLTAEERVAMEEMWKYMHSEHSPV